MMQMLHLITQLYLPQHIPLLIHYLGDEQRKERASNEHRTSIETIVRVSLERTSQNPNQSQRKSQCQMPLSCVWKRSNQSLVLQSKTNAIECPEQSCELIPFNFNIALLWKHQDVNFNC